MKLRTEDRNVLFKALERKGWFWDGDFIYAPHKTMWLLGADPWQGDLEDFHERMSARVQRIIRDRAYQTIYPQQHHNCVEDTESLVAALGKLFKAQRDI